MSSRVGLKSWPSRPREGRRGEKLPAATGAVTDRFVEVEFAALDGQGSWLVFGLALGSAFGAGLLGGEGVVLLFEEGGDGALGQAAGGGGGDLLHGGEVERDAGGHGLKGASSDDFAPLGSELLDLLESFGGQVPLQHAFSSLGVR
jgi:hypothetical protein